jgi:hypothetical protein
MQQIKEEMSSNAKSFYIQTHKKPEGTTTPQQILCCNSCTIVNPQATDETKMEKRERTVCHIPRNLKHRGITRNQRMAENNIVGSLALPSIHTKMAKTPTYTQTNNSGGTKKVH